MSPLNDCLFRRLFRFLFLTEVQFNEDILYQDYNYNFPVEGGNEKPGKWYGRALNHGDGMCSWILTADDELIAYVLEHVLC